MRRLVALTELDWWLVGPLAYLVTIGLVVQYAILFKTKGAEIEFNLAPQIGAIVLALITAGILSLLSTVGWRRLALKLYYLSVVMLSLVALVGVSAGGAARWLRLGGFQIQPSELAKLAVILLLARLFDNRSGAVNRTKTVAVSFVAVAIPMALTAIQPDLGSSLVFIFIWLAMLLASKMRFSRIALVLLVVMSATVMSIPFMADYQQQRLISYFNPNSDTQGANYNTIQAAIAIGSGGVNGNGLDSGTQSQLNFLPSQHTDFIFAVLGEKLGLIGASSVVVAAGILIGRMLWQARRCAQAFERGLIVGVASLLLFHTVINIGMNVGLLPVTGIPLPFLSYGGTFTFVSLLGALWVVVITHRLNSGRKTVVAL